MALSFQGGEINYKVSGEGPAIVFLHGFLESLKIWKKFEEFFSQQYKIIAIDLPGHGKSSNFNHTHTMEFMAEAVNAVLEHENIAQAMFVGHSMGGYVALSLIEQNESKCLGLCLFSSTVFEDTEERKHERERAIKAVESHKMKFITAVVPNLFYNRSGKKSGKRIYRLVKIAARQSKEGIIAAIKGMLLRKDKSEVLKKANYPILLIGGHDDYLIPTERLDEMASFSKQAQVKIFERCGHVGFYEAKTESMQALFDFTQAQLKSI